MQLHKLLALCQVPASSSGLHIIHSDMHRYPARVKPLKRDHFIAALVVNEQWVNNLINYLLDRQ